MNIGITFTSDAATFKHYKDMARQMTDYAARADGYTVVDTAPDLVHVFGTFSMETRHLLTTYRKRRIPTVLTVCGALATYADHNKTIDSSQLNLQRRSLLSAATVVHTTGSEEDAAITANAPKVQTAMIANAAITSAISTDEMCSDLTSLYRTTIKRHEHDIAADIAATVSRAAARLTKSGTASNGADGSKPTATLPSGVRAMLSGILYSRYLNNRGLFSLPRHKEMARALVNTAYDEDLLLQLLSRTKTKTFAAALMALLADEGLLTEGFMPLPPARHPLKLKTF